MEALVSTPRSDAIDPTELVSDPKQLGCVPGLVWAFRIHDDGTADALPIGEPIESRHDGWVWLHLDLTDARVSPWLEALDLSRSALGVLLSRDPHQQLHATDSCVYGAIADLVRQIDGATDEFSILRFIMTERLLVSGRHHALTAPHATRTALADGERKLTHVAALLELLVEQVADGIDTVADDLGEELDQIEDDLARRSLEFERQKLARVRRTSVRLHRQLSGLRAVFHRLERQGMGDIKPSLRLAVGKLVQRLDSLDHDMLELRERGHRLQEELSFVMSEQINRHLFALAIITALFLPPTFVTGVFGMNTKGLPFTDWDTAFLCAMALCIGSSLAVYLIMRMRGMFRS